MLAGRRITPSLPFRSYSFNILPESLLFQCSSKDLFHMPSYILLILFKLKTLVLYEADRTVSFINYSELIRVQNFYGIVVRGKIYYLWKPEP